MNRLIALIPAVALAGFAAAFDLPRLLGAHPWWSLQVLTIGFPAGALIAFAAGFLNRRAVFITLFAVAGISAYSLAKYGQVQFAASYAEDQIAGKFWYFGWIAFSASAAALVTSLTQAFLKKPYPTE